MTTEDGTSVVSQANAWLRKISRISAWALLAGIVILVFSGWGITQTGIIHTITFGLVDRRLANTIHGATTVPLVLFFLLHVFANISLKISKSSTSIKWIVNSLLCIFGVLVLGAAVYMEYFRQGG